MANNNIEDQILAGDKTILDVFGEKSKDFDDMIPSGKNIFGQETSPLSQIELLEMIMPFAGSIRGGKVAKSTMEQLLDLGKRFGVGRKSQASWVKPSTIKEYAKQNKESANRLKYIKAREGYDAALDKYSIKDPDRAEFLDSISAYLTRSRN